MMKFIYECECEPTLNEIYYRDLQFVWAESWLLESSSVGDVLQYLVILDTRIGTATKTEHLPTCHSIGPLEEKGGRGEEKECVCMRVEESVRVCVWGGGGVCMCNKYMCVCMDGDLYMYMYMCELQRVWYGRVHVSVLERERECVCVHVFECEHV